MYSTLLDHTFYAFFNLFTTRLSTLLLFILLPSERKTQAKFENAAHISDTKDSERTPARTGKEPDETSVCIYVCASA